jgi:excisionase family DNA binding protein
MTERILTPSQVAKRIGRSYDHVLRLIKAGKLKAANDGAGQVPRWRIREADVERLLYGNHSEKSEPAATCGYQ